MQASKKRKSPSAFTYSGTPVRVYGPTRSDFKKKEVVTKEQLTRALRSNDELKYFDVASAGAVNVSFSGTFTCLSSMAQGVTAITRNGDRVLPKSLRIRGLYNAGSTNNVLRTIIFRWNVNDTSDAPQMAEILDGAFLGSAHVVFAPYSMYNRARFSVLYDKLTYVQYAVGTSEKPIKIDLKLAQKKIQYYQGANTGQYHIYMLNLSDDGVVTYPTTNWISRLTFTDS